ncbi:hypothetical protein [Demequina sp. NBRC 110057]|uniref:hypothetical protein n=1 Tax=Demequina sp. NBRC 110057 TaxID=1570346 RepID=UPI000A041E53|nr:hypothetical protein [Demequina sp. NBRC 110057]
MLLVIAIPLALLPFATAVVAMVLWGLARPGSARSASITSGYPTTVMTWLIAGPAGAAAAMGLIVGLQGGEHGGDGNGPEAHDDFPPPWDLVMLILALGAAAVIVLAHLTRRRPGPPAWWMLVAATPGVGAVGWAVVSSIATGEITPTVLGLVMIGGGIANGVLAMRAQAARAATMPASAMRPF